MGNLGILPQLRAPGYTSCPICERPERQRSLRGGSMMSDSDQTDSDLAGGSTPGGDYDPCASSVLNEAAAKGDSGALAELLERHLPALEAFVRVRAGRVVRQTESSADIVQSVCREVLQHADRFRHPSEGAFRRWLFRTALRKLVNRRDYHLAEKRDLFRRVPIEGSGESKDWNAVRESRLVDVYRSFSSPSQHAEARDEIERVESALDRLGQKERDVIVQAHLLGLTRDEIAEEMGCSSGAVRVLLHRALAKLVDLVVTDSEEDGAQ